MCYTLFGRLSGLSLSSPIKNRQLSHFIRTFMTNPEYFDALSEADKHTYNVLRDAFSAPGSKNRRNRTVAAFQEIIGCIHTFVIGTDSNHQKRALVCGIAWLNDSIAVNVHQLSMLTSKCKSSINGLFQSLGYGTVPYGSEAAAPLLCYFPFLQNNFPELRKWTVRQKITSPQTPSYQTAPSQFDLPDHTTPPPTEPATFAQFELGLGKQCNEDENTTYDGPQSFADALAWDPYAFWDPDRL
jgi:hypothetical protein